MTLSADTPDRPGRTQAEAAGDANEAEGAGASLGLGIAAGIGASLCCLPIVLLLAGVSGAWMGALTAMEPYRPIFIGWTVVFLGLAFRKLYLVPRACSTSNRSVPSMSLKRQRAILWIVTVLAVAFIAFPWYVPFLLK